MQNSANNFSFSAKRGVAWGSPGLMGRWHQFRSTGHALHCPPTESCFIYPVHNVRPRAGSNVWKEQMWDLNSPGAEDKPLKRKRVHTYKEYYLILVQADRPTQPRFWIGQSYWATLDVLCILSHHVYFPKITRSFSVSSMVFCTWDHI